MFQLAQRRFSLGAWLALAFTSLSLLLTVLLTVFSDRTASTQVRRSIGNNLAELSNQITSRLDQAMFERYREVRLIANRLNGPLDLAVVKREIDALQQSYPTYAWIGVTDPDGRVVIASRGLLEGLSVAERQTQSQIAETLWREAQGQCKGQAQQLQGFFLLVIEDADDRGPERHRQAHL